VKSVAEVKHSTASKLHYGNGRIRMAWPLMTQDELHFFGIELIIPCIQEEGVTIESVNLNPKMIMRKDTNTAKLTGYEKERNKKISKKRYIVEQYFGLSQLHQGAHRARFTVLIQGRGLSAARPWQTKKVPASYRW
jgi:hypothetical protein